MADPIAGQIVRLKTAPGFQDPTGAAIDPSTVQLIVKDPTGAVTTYSYPTGVTKDSVGVYHVDVDTTGKPGLWTFAWKSSGTGQAYAWSSFVVDPAPL